MTKANRRGWLDKISRWILDVFPGESSQQQASTPPSPIREPEPTAAATAVAAPRSQPAKPAPPAASPKTPQRSTPQAQPPAEAPAASAPAAPEPPAEKTLIKAWRAFELAWKEAGLSPSYFLDADALISTLSVLDQSFEEELIEWLYQLCTKPQALTALAAIIERGQVRPTDNVDAIRAFAYVSVAVVSRPVRQAPIQPHAPQPNQATQRASTAVAIPQTDRRAGVPNQAVEELGLSMRCYNALKRSDIHRLLDLAGRSEESLLEIRNFGARSVTEVRDALEKLGLGLPFAASEISGHRPLNRDDAAQESSPTTRNAPDRLGDVKDLGLSARTLNCLYRGKVFSIAELIRCTESDLLSFPNLGQTALDEIHKVLADRDLALAVPS